MCRWIEIVRQLGDGSLRHDPALLHDTRNGVGRTPCEFDILLDQDDRDAVLPVEADDHRFDLLDDVGLDALGRLVEQHDLGLGQQRAGDRELLLLAAGEIAAAAVEEFLQDREQVEHPARRCRHRRLGRGEGAEHQVFAHRESRQDAAALRHVGDAGPGPLMGGQRRHFDAVEGDARRSRGPSGPRMLRIKVVLPTPLRPSTERNSPASTCRLTPCSARLLP